jgi:hypothetical protein
LGDDQKADDKEHKETVTYKMGLGDLWLVGSLKSDLDKQTFHSKNRETSGAKVKKYGSVWLDGTSPPR